MGNGKARGVVWAVTVLSVPFLLVVLAGCPSTTPAPSGGGGGGGSTTPTTLLNVLLNATAPPIPIPNRCTTAATSFFTSATMVAGKLVTVTTTGPTSLSRPQIIVFDNVGQVANSGTTPVSQTATTSFTPASAGFMGVYVFDCQTGITGAYQVTATQAP